MADVFVSYKSDDRRRVQPLVAALEADGLSVWWDTQIGGGAAWRECIEDQLSAAKCVIVIWSKRSLGPHAAFVRDEASRAVERGIYLPVKLDGSRPPLGFGETQAVGLARWTGDRSDVRYQALLASVRSIIAQNPVPVHQFLEPRLSRRGVLVAGSAAALAAASTGAWYFRHLSSTGSSNSIAVLPFANLSGDPAEAYFSDGMAEELRTSLARLGGLKVVGRTSSEVVRNDDAQAAAKKLQVATVLIGSVRRSPSTIRVAAQLIDGTTGIERWSQDYDRTPGDTIRIQTDIAERVAQALKIALGTAGRAVLTVGGTDNVDAQNLILEADTLLENIFNEQRARRGLELIDAAIVLDPNYAGAYARRGVLLNTMSLFYSHGPNELKEGQLRALESANKAVGLAPRLGWAHLALAQIQSGQLKIGPASAEYREALKLGPSDANTKRLYARFLALIGREQEALGLAEQAIALEPLSAESYNFRTFVLYRARRYADAERTTRELMLHSPSLSHPPIEYSYSLIMLGRLPAAKASLQRAPATDPGRIVAEAILFARNGDQVGALRSTAALQHLTGDNANYSIAAVRAQLGQTDQAFDALGRAFDAADYALIGLLTDPFMDPLRSDPRFKAALNRLRYPPALS